MRHACIATLLAACGALLPAATPPAQVTPAAVAATHAELAQRSYADALDEAQALHQAIATFVAAPSADALDATRTQWRTAHDAWSRTEVFRFQNGPIDDEDGPEGLINGWPLDEQWIDATVDAPGAGLINRTDLDLTRAAILDHHERGGEKHIATGFHAIEFLLWGQDRDAKGPGDRPFTDYTTGAHANRRGQYLTLVSDLLVEHIASVAAAWAPGMDTYRAAFLAKDAQLALQDICTGLAMLAGFELAGERLAVAYETQDQEEEHSCFSDHTNANTRENIVGLANVWRGEHDDWRGASLRDLVVAKDPAAAAAVDAALTASIDAAASIPDPFDQAILGAEDASSRRAVLATIEALEGLGQTFVAAGKTFGLDVPMSEPEAE